MKNILLILVGGTICTSINKDGILSVSENAGALIKANFENSDSPYAKNVNIELTDNLFILSENMTVDKWNDIIQTYVNYTSKKKYDGIIFAHGTDTLAYSSALFSMLLSTTDIPVFFVSSNRRLDAKDSNGNENFKAAVELIAKGITPNVYVTYKNPSDNRMYLHLGSRLEQCKNYSDDFYSCGMLDITDICDENYKVYLSQIETMYPKENTKSFISIYDCPKLSECILLIQPYVGINYSVYDYSNFRAVLHGTFHSGTACAEQDSKNSVLHLIKVCSELENDVDTYISPSKLNGEIYETVSTIAHSKIVFLYGYTLETAYAKLLIAYSLFDSNEKRSEFIKTECNYEIICKEW